jgi:hypothetical protein
MPDPVKVNCLDKCTKVDAVCFSINLSHLLLLAYFVCSYPFLSAILALVSVIRRQALVMTTTATRAHHPQALATLVAI